MPRSRTTTRFHWSTRYPVTLDCPCGWRLAVLEIRSDLPPIANRDNVAVGIYFARTQSVAGWRQITCRDCAAIWRVPEDQITELVRRAADERQMTEAIRGVRGERDTRVTLESEPITRPEAPARLPWSALRIPPDRDPRLIGARDGL